VNAQDGNSNLIEIMKWDGINGHTTAMKKSNEEKRTAEKRIEGKLRTKYYNALQCNAANHRKDGCTWHEYFMFIIKP